jgi:hypothetical protein
MAHAIHKIRADANPNDINNVKDDPSYVDNVDGFTWD